MDIDTKVAPIWVLLGAKHGDNQQLLAIAKALKTPFRVVPLRFNLAASLPPVWLGPHRLSWRSDAQLVPPWPQAVLAAGRKSVPAARWIRRQSGGTTRLIHVNRPWAPLSWFDLIVTTPQYALPARQNVVCNLMPFVAPPAGATPTASFVHPAAALPRPWTVVLVGGNSRPFVLGDVAAQRLANVVNAQVRDAGGSAWVLDSPRTPDATLSIIEQALEVPSHAVRWRDGCHLYGTLLGLGDRFIVTSDSVSMLSEALLTGKPVQLFDLPVRPDLRWRVASAWAAAAARAPASMTARSFEAMRDLGLLSSTRDLALLHRALNDAQLLGGDGRALERVERERRATLARIAQLMQAR